MFKGQLYIQKSGRNGSQTYIKPKTIKLLEESTGKYLSSLGYPKISPDRTQKMKTKKKKMIKLKFTEIKNCSWKY